MRTRLGKRVERRQGDRSSDDAVDVHVCTSKYFALYFVFPGLALSLSVGTFFPLECYQSRSTKYSSVEFFSLGSIYMNLRET